MGYVNGKTTSTGGNVTLRIEAGYDSVSRSGNTVSANIYGRMGMGKNISGTTSWSSNQFAIWLPAGGEKRSVKGSGSSSTANKWYESGGRTVSWNVTAGQTSLGTSVGFGWNAWDASQGNTVDMTITFGAWTLWNNINAYYPDGTTEGGLTFDLRTSDGGAWNNLTNEPSGFTKVYGTTATISNIRCNTTGAYYSGNNVTNSTASSFSWTFNTADWACKLYSAYYTYYRDINAYQPNGSTQNGLIFDYYIYNRSGTLVNSYKDVTNEVSGTVTREYGYTCTINNIRPNVTGAHYSGNNITNTAASSFSYTFNVESAVHLYSAWNTYTVKFNANGGEGSMEDQGFTYGTAQNLRSNSYTRSGYTFLGWSTSSTATSATYSNGQSVNNLTTTHGGIVTLYAVWQIIALPNTSSSVTNILPKSFDLQATADGTISFVSTKYASTKVKNLLTQYNMPVKVLSDGSVWIRLYYHDSKGGSVLWNGTAAQAINNQEADRYSRLNLLGNDDFKINGKFELMLTYPTNTDTGYNRWRQTKAPQNEAMPKTSTGTTVTGYEAIHIDWSGSYWGGLELNNTTEAPCYIDGSVGHGNWWYAIAPKTPYNGGVPGPSAQVFRQTEIWLRVPEVTGRVINATANTTIHVEDLDDESTYVICSRTRNSAGAAYSSIVTCDTPVDQAKTMIKKDGNWVLGKTFIKVNGEWIKAKKVYIKKDGQWVVNVNPRN